MRKEVGNLLVKNVMPSAELAVGSCQSMLAMWPHSASSERG